MTRTVRKLGVAWAYLLQLFNSFAGGEFGILVLYDYHSPTTMDRHAHPYYQRATRTRMHNEIRFAAV
jgi:hypothetical protein